MFIYVKPNYFLIFLCSRICRKSNFSSLCVCGSITHFLSWKINEDARDWSSSRIRDRAPATRILAIFLKNRSLPDISCRMASKPALNALIWGFSVELQENSHQSQSTFANLPQLILKEILVEGYSKRLLFLFKQLHFKLLLEWPQTGLAESVFSRLN